MASASGSAHKTASSSASKVPSAAAAASTSSSGLPMRSDHPAPRAGHRLTGAALVLGVVAALSLLTGGAATPRYFPDDPIQADDDRAFDASAAKEIEGSNGYDFAEQTFFKPGDRNDIRAVNVN